MAVVVAVAVPSARAGTPADRVAVARPRVVTTVVTRVGIPSASASPLRPARRRAAWWRSRARSCPGPPRPPRPHRSRTRSSRKASRSPRARSPWAKARAKVIADAAAAVAGVVAVAVATSLPSTVSSRSMVPWWPRLSMAKTLPKARRRRRPTRPRLPTRLPTRRSRLLRDRNGPHAEADRGPRRASCRRRSTTWTRSPQRRVPRSPRRSAPSGADSPVPRPLGLPPVWRRSPTTTKISRSRPSRSTCSPSSVVAREAVARAVAVPGAVAVAVSAARTPQPSTVSVTAVVVAAPPAASPSRPAVVRAVAVARVPRGARVVAVGSSPRVARGLSARIASIVLRARAARSGARSRRSSSRCSGRRCSAAGPL